MDQYRASLLTIGTEVSTGQIVNTNASWVADQLVNLHFDPICHLTVSDNEKDILDALDYLAKRCSYIFVTGGLGPTSDDITRQVICKWAGDDLRFDEGSWHSIEQRFQQLGVPASDNNRQQCYFPSRASVISNPKGTANAFSLLKDGLYICCLPGPPEEIKAIWHSSLGEDLKTKVKDADPYQLFRWQCLGLSESTLGEIVEKVIANTPLVSGYRPHIPYVEIKIWCRKSQIESQKAVFSALDEALKKWTVVRNDDDCVQLFFEAISSFENIVIFDAASQGAIGERLGLALSPGKKQTGRITYHSSFRSPLDSIPEPVSDRTLHLEIQPIHADGQWTIAWRTVHAHRQRTLKLPFRKDPNRADRERRFVCEMSLAAWGRTPSGDLWT